MTLRGWIWVGTGVVLVALVAVVVGVLSSLDSIVEAAIETYGSELTGTDVRVDSVEIELASGRGTVRGLTVANPDGFSPGAAFSLGEITLEIDVGTLTDEPVVVDAVVIAAPVVRWELGASGRSNVDVILAHVKRYGAGGEPAASGGGARTSGAAEPPESETRLVIRRFTFSDGEVHATLGKGSVSEKLPPLVLRDIGGSDGATPTAIGVRIASAYSQRVVQTVARRQVERRIDDALRGAGGEAGKAAQELFKRLLE